MLHEMYRKVDYMKPIKDTEHSFTIKSFKQAQLNL